MTRLPPAATLGYEKGANVSILARTGFPRALKQDFVRCFQGSALRRLVSYMPTLGTLADDRASSASFTERRLPGPMSK